MDNTLIDDRRIRVDFSQSVARLWRQYRHGKRSTKDGCFKCGAPDHIARDCVDEPDEKQEGPKYILKEANTQHGERDLKSYDMLFDEENLENAEQKHAKKMKTIHHKSENPRHHDHDNKSSGKPKHEADRTRRHREDEKEKPSVRDEKYYIDSLKQKNGDREHTRKHESSKQRSDERDHRRSDAHERESYRKDDGENEKRRDRIDRYRRDDRSYGRSRDQENESYRERRHRDGRR